MKGMSQFVRKIKMVGAGWHEKGCATKRDKLPSKLIFRVVEQSPNWKDFGWALLNNLHVLLLMEQILHHLGCIKPVNNGMNIPMNWLAGFQPSTISFMYHI